MLPSREGVEQDRLRQWHHRRAIPQASVASVNTPIDQTITRFSPNRATSQPVIGVTIAVARMLKVIAQAISSWVADIAPCICGRMVEVVSSAVP